MSSILSLKTLPLHSAEICRAYAANFTVFRCNPSTIQRSKCSNHLECRSRRILGHDRTIPNRCIDCGNILILINSKIVFKLSLCLCVAFHAFDIHHNERTGRSSFVSFIFRTCFLFTFSRFNIIFDSVDTNLLDVAINCKLYTCSRYRFYTQRRIIEVTVFLICRPDVIWLFTILAMQITLHLSFNSTLTYQVRCLISHRGKFRKSLLRMRGILRQRCIHTSIFFIRQNAHIMVILFQKHSNKIFWNIFCDHDRSSGLERPVIHIDLISDTNNAVSFLFCIVFIQFKLSSKEKEKYLRITFHIEIDICYDRIRIRFF